MLKCHYQLFIRNCRLQVLGRKVNPEASYVDIEKRPVKEYKEFKSSPSQLSEAEFSRLLNKEGRSNSKPLEGVYKPQRPASQDENLPGLVKPPARPGMPLPQVLHYPLRHSFCYLPATFCERFVTFLATFDHVGKL